MENIINLDKYSLVYDNDDSIYTFMVDNKKYFFKKNGYDNSINELVGEELAKDFGLSYVHYDFVKYNNEYGVISEDFIKNKKYTNFIEILLYEYDEKYFEREVFNLYDIWNSLSKKYKDDKLVYKLMNQLTDIFIFDFLIGNNDRHDGNIGILEDENGINITPVFDNELLLEESKALDSVLKVDDEYVDDWRMSFTKFITQSSEKYKDKVKDKMWIIDEENIRSVIERVEKRINSKLREDYKKYIILGFENRREELERLLNERKLV